MKVIVDWDLCDGNGVCAVEAPSHFEMDDQDELHLLKEDVASDEQRDVESAVRVCPKRALALQS